MCGGWGVVPGYELDTLWGARKVVERLAAYEDTGLTPEEVAELVKAKAQGPCGLCRYSPPSCCDGSWKPCRFCLAEKGDPHETDSV